MTSNISNRSRWILTSVFLTIGSIIFALAWTAPFWPEWIPILGSDLFKTTFFFISSGIFILLFIFSLYLLYKATPPSLEPVHKPETG